MLHKTISALTLTFSLAFLQAEEAELPVKVDPTWSAKDTNPKSKTFGKEVTSQSFKGRTTLWLLAFDSDC